MNWKPISEAPKGEVVLISVDGNVEFGIIEWGKWYVINNGDYTDGGYGGNYRCEESNTKIFDFPRYSIPDGWMPLPVAIPKRKNP